MKKDFLLIAIGVFAIMICGLACSHKHTSSFEPAHSAATTEEQQLYKIIVIDSCEYVTSIYRGGICHKGNCRFCEERKQKK